MKYMYDMYQTVTVGKRLIDSNKEVRTRIEALTKAVTDMTDYQVACNAILVDNVERYVRESARMRGINDSIFSSNFGPYLRHVMNLASVMYSTFELKDIISVQPLEKRIGALYFAMWINPTFKYAALKFVYDQMIKYRNEAGDAYRELGSSVQKIVPRNSMKKDMKKIG